MARSLAEKNVLDFEPKKKKVAVRCVASSLERGGVVL